MIDSKPGGSGVRVLVAIASYGDRQLEYLKEMIHAYKEMALDVDVVVLSEAPKALGSSVEVVVGLPSKNPWTLPFAHKAIFAQRLDRYDLFLYSEDDMEVTEQNLNAFMRVTPQLAPDEIAGFLRYEVDSSGNRFLPDFHGSFRWKPEFVRRRGDHTVAEFTNEHAGFYILTQAQLRRAIASGGFLRGPRRGRYGWPETAATDPYGNSGFRKVICISASEDFFIHHRSNRYVGKLGIPLSSFEEQVQTLQDICNGVHPPSTLCGMESKVLERNWSKRYDEDPYNELLRMVPEEAKTVLSVGCGSGAVEGVLKKRGCEVTALPLDSVVGAMAARRGIEVIYGTLDESLKILRGRKFDCVVITNLLHLLPDPWSVLKECANFVREAGAFVVVGPNFNSIPVLVRRALGSNDHRKLRSFTESGIHVFGMRVLAKQLENACLKLTAVRWFDSTPPRSLVALRRLLGRFMAKDLVIRAERKE